MKAKQKRAVDWFKTLQNQLLSEFISIEKQFSSFIPQVDHKHWERPGGGGGHSIVIYGKVFEKAGINVSEVYGDMEQNHELSHAVNPSELSNTFIGKDKKFWASGISVVAHMCSPFVPAVHMNTRFICISDKNWFGGGIDLTPTYENKKDQELFHSNLREMCDQYDKSYYQKFKQQCDEYFFLHHRKEPRGIGGIFYDNINSGNWEADFQYTQAVGKFLLDIYPIIVKRNLHTPWTAEEREYQLVKRGRYVEFNLIYDRGTRFGLLTNGNPDAIMMSMPPIVKWK
ncbi:coproporphyrinogen III oxidase family protein [Ehrlichia chaffeensis str. Heartland]|uniref:oxygen-dependent coproporphyrinogen oxidase n=1 Tax=Ehrlichia chaffeensis TaxID=945 RepID=UPI000444D51F|nr:oxygen-dependent coproporphyrinogen oxidase [Ehrlichia chaffeensis]AHX03675.1 coproporphyrinogen III oxidase family protein [Ehrlichia chaffeensis str. Heartland]AHX05604.1 coproporphyrinogen III oxidase family protein [Ehrlichia chaffeensis str. Jax]AHX09278.1 coproporphyrinogen III oxidase family protein [Ehrlichia chaffeensis str. Wakulla]AHX10795.1 coproporphyrinogen III oxidase family protein [Ehrlichia chaffeensis str. West Paces]